MRAKGNSGRQPNPIPESAHASVQLQRGTRGAPRTRPRESRRGNARLAWDRHVGDGNEPPRQGVHRHRGQGRRRLAHTARDSDRLRSPLPSGGCDRRERDHSDEPPRRKEGRRLREHRRMVEEVDQGSEEVLHRQHRGVRSRHRDGDRPARPARRTGSRRRARGTNSPANVRW